MAADDWMKNRRATSLDWKRGSHALHMGIMARVSTIVGLSVVCLVFTCTVCAAAAVGMTITAAPDTSTVLRATDDRYLSVNIDGSQLAHFPFQDSVLNSLAQSLGGRSYLRVGTWSCTCVLPSWSDQPVVHNRRHRQRCCVLQHDG